MAKTIDDYIAQAKIDFNEFCDRYDGKQYNTVRRIGNPYNYEDINYKSITARITNVGDRCRVLPQVVDVWDETGKLKIALFLD